MKPMLPRYVPGADVPVLRRPVITTEPRFPLGEPEARELT
jgi:hypothetical protein